MTKQAKQEQMESIEKLRSMLKPGDSVWTSVNSVSKSGMSRNISLFIPDTFNGKPEITNITWHVARAVGYPTKNRSGYVQDVGIAVSGCGMDMCFDTVYNLGRVLFPDGFKVEGRGRNGDTSGWDNDGGYALNKRDM